MRREGWGAIRRSLIGLALLVSLGASFAAQGQQTYWVKSLNKTFSSLAEAEAAMRARNPGFHDPGSPRLLEFKELRPGTNGLMERFYHVPDVKPEQFWNMCSEYVHCGNGCTAESPKTYFNSPQEICDVVSAYPQFVHRDFPGDAHRYEASAPYQDDGFGTGLGECRTTWIDRRGGANLEHKNYTTAYVKAQIYCPKPGYLLKNAGVQTYDACSPTKSYYRGGSTHTMGRGQYWNNKGHEAICSSTTTDVITCNGGCQAFYLSVAPRPRQCDTAGNPIAVATGNKSQVELDYAGETLRFARIYNSEQADPAGGFNGWNFAHFRRLIPRYTGSSSAPGVLINSSRHSSEREACEEGWPEIRERLPGLLTAMATFDGHSCNLSIDGRRVATAQILQESFSAPVLAGYYVETQDGDRVLFSLIDGAYQPEPGATGTLVADEGGLTYTDNNRTQRYDAAGRLLSMAGLGRDGRTYHYDEAGRLIEMRDAAGRALRLGYDEAGRLSDLTDPAGGVTRYGYSAAGQLVRVQRPDGTERGYRYDKPGQPFALTGLVDENGVLFAAWDYDEAGRAILSEHAGGVDRTVLSYHADGRTTVEGADGHETTYTFTRIHGRDRLSGLNRPCESGCAGGGFAATTYDANGFVASRTDFNGHVTRYVHDDAGRERTRTEAYGSAAERTVTTEWHPHFRLPVAVHAPGLTTTWTYDAQGNPTLRRRIDTASGEVRTTTYTYNAQYLLETVDGPREDVADLTHYTYDTRGQLTRITNALGHVTQLSGHDAHGHPTRLLDPNGVETLLVYDARQRLIERRQAGAITRYAYDGVGQLTRITLPDGASLHYAYDPAQRLIGIADDQGNRLQYTLDARGNRLRETVLDPEGSLKRLLRQTFDAHSRLSRVLGAHGQLTTYGYDAQGNRLTVTAAGQVPEDDRVTALGYDPLHRLLQVTDAAGGRTHYQYNALDQLTAVTDPKGLSTRYTYTAHGDLIAQSSPDTGLTRYTYDAAGNRTGQTDARGVSVTYRYDALNRLTAIDYPGTEADVTYHYDQASDNGTPTHGIGRLTRVQDASGQTVLAYDARGNLIRQQHQIGEQTSTTQYRYDAADRLVGMTYPTGRIVTYERTPLGQVSRVTTTLDGMTATVAQDIDYLPFGGVERYTLGNGLHVTRQFDPDYRLTELQARGDAGPVHHLRLSYDLHDQITAIQDLRDPARSQTFGYDALSRLRSARGAYGEQAWTYDAVGNRLRQTLTPPDGRPATDTYHYPAGSHRLAAITGTHALTLDYDAAGHTTRKGDLRLSYNAAQRPVTVTQGRTTVHQVHAASGQRASKTVDRQTLHYHYDRQGQLLAELDSAGQPVREYLYLDTLPLAQITHPHRPGRAPPGKGPPSGQGPPPQASLPDQAPMVVHTDYAHPDHLGTVQRLTDARQQIVWDAVYTPFGQTQIQTQTQTQNPPHSRSHPLRFPGQYADMETGLHPNWYRDYDPALGRYLQSDPIGLRGGLNTYTYVGGSPVSYIDPLGLEATNWWNNTGGRNPATNGPTNGNWGGKCWSGGQYSCGDNSPGNVPPTDSGDACYQRHDNCYVACGTNKQCIAVCDDRMVDELRQLPDDPRQWPQPPRPGTEGDSRRYRDAAIRYFK